MEKSGLSKWCSRTDQPTNAKSLFIVDQNCLPVQSNLHIHIPRFRFRALVRTKFQRGKYVLKSGLVIQTLAFTASNLSINSSQEGFQLPKEANDCQGQM